MRGGVSLIFVQCEEIRVVLTFFVDVTRRLMCSAPLTRESTLLSRLSSYPRRSLEVRFVIKVPNDHFKLIHRF